MKRPVTKDERIEAAGRLDYGGQFGTPQERTDKRLAARVLRAVAGAEEAERRLAIAGDHQRASDKREAGLRRDVDALVAARDRWRRQAEAAEKLVAVMREAYHEAVNLASRYSLKLCEILKVSPVELEAALSQSGGKEGGSDVSTPEK